MRTTPLFTALVLAAAVVTGCGDDGDEKAETTETTAPQAAAAAGEAQLAPIKDYLLAHTSDLSTNTAKLSGQAEEYFALAKAANFDYAQMLKDDPEKVQDLVSGMQETWRKANPSYEEAEGVVAGVPSLSEYDVILDAGSSGAEPETAVPFDLTYANGKVLKKPGNYFFLTETSLWGTEDKFVAKGVKPDLNGDGKVEYGEALPDAYHIQAAAKGFDQQAKKLDASSKEWQPTEDDVFNAVVVMTPTMAEYFEAWKNSRFVAGDKATEASFVGSSRLGDITGILGGLTVVYDGIEPKIATEDPAQAKQVGENLDGLLAYVESLREKEAGGTQFTAEQADTYGTEAQKRAEAIAGQVSQTAAALGIKVES
ncbi:MAG: hypothetical protein JHC95_18965 [Solirubrobacteraceae bacterium]|nr:hypothetical protein [Solirubrobacteraceae bacterium]